MPTKAAGLHAGNRVEQFAGRSGDAYLNADQHADGDAHTGGCSVAHVLGKNPCHDCVPIHAEQSRGKTFRSMIQQARGLLQMAAFCWRSFDSQFPWAGMGTNKRPLSVPVLTFEITIDSTFST